MEKKIVTFEIGRGGRFNNGGHRTFFNDCGIGDVYIVQEDLYPAKLNPNDPNDNTPDESPEAEWTDCDGNSVELTNAMIESGIGRINIDHEYHSYYSTYLADCDENELLHILEADRKDLIKQYIDEHTDLQLDWKRFKSDKWKDLIEVAFLHPKTQSLYLPELLEEEDED